MVALRSVLALQALLVVSFALEPGRPTSAVVMGQFKAAVAMPGTGLAAMTPEQSTRMVCRVNELLTGNPRDASRLDEFTSTMRAAKQTEDACLRRVASRGRTVKGVCREIGVLLLRQQTLEREGRKPQLAASLRQLVEARRKGVSEERVQAMAREAVANNELSPGADEECRSIQERLDELTGQLVKAGRLLAGRASGGAPGGLDLQALAAGSAE